MQILLFSSQGVSCVWCFLIDLLPLPLLPILSHTAISVAPRTTTETGFKQEKLLRLCDDLATTILEDLPSLVAYSVDCMLEEY